MNSPFSSTVTSFCYPNTYTAITCSYTIASSGTASWLSFNSATLTFTGTPTSATTVYLTVQCAVDALGSSSSTLLIQI
jgi:hypothetical protein